MPIMLIRFVMSVILSIMILLLVEWAGSRKTGTSIMGDPGMGNAAVRVFLEGWNFCNYPGPGAVPSPRYADCFDDAHLPNRITDRMNDLTYPTTIPGYPRPATPAEYAISKELYLGDVCRAQSSYSFWTFMLKSGILDKSLRLCPSVRVAEREPRSLTESLSPDYPMNQPRVFHDWTNATSTSGEIRGGFYGTYDIAALARTGSFSGLSFFNATWTHENGKTTFYHSLRTSKTYRWLMLYTRSDGIDFPNGGYPYRGRGVLLEKPNGAVRLRVYLEIQQAEPAAHIQFYLPEISGCWPSFGSGEKCGEGRKDDATRYVCFILNPEIEGHCSFWNQGSCPPYHISSSGEHISRSNFLRFPYHCYYYYCDPKSCDPYSNPIPQEIMQLLPCEEWTPYGFPKKGEGWVGDGRSYDLDVEGLRNRLYYYGNATVAERDWLSFEIGPEVMDQGASTRWIIRDWDVVRVKV